MGKNKKKQNSEQNQNQDENQNQNQNQNQEENNTDEKTNEKPDENADEKGDEKTNKGKQNAGAIVLGVHLHCQGCVETVVKALRGFDGVEEIEPNPKDSKVTVKGKSADPVKVAERVRRKTGKHVELISPKPKKEAEKKEQDKKSEKKPEAPKVIETVLKMHLHCEGCAKDVRHCILKMEGVQTVNVDMNTSHVTVKGAFDPKNLVAYISKRAGRHAEIVNPKNKQNNKKNDNDNNNDGEPKQENEKNEKKEKGKGGKNEGSPYPDVSPGLFYAQDLFSDENPNACSIM